MNTSRYSCVLISLLLLCALSHGAYSPQPAAPFAVKTFTLEWSDQARSRSIPVRIYQPDSSGGPFPVVLFSHGLGGSREGYSYLGNHWAACGYVSVHLQHEGSDSGVWRGRTNIRESFDSAAADPMNAVDRARDVKFAIDELERMNESDSPLKGMLNLEAIGLAGHSFGANTTLMAAGQSASQIQRLGADLSDKRIKAAIPMSAPVPKRRVSLDQIYSPIKIPCLHMTGTLDDSPIGDTKAAERRIPFDHIAGADQYLVIFQGGDHMIFSGRLVRDDSDEKFQDLIRQGTTAFWDAYLKNDSTAKTWLSEGGFSTALGNSATLEIRMK